MKTAFLLSLISFLCLLQTHGQDCGTQLLLQNNKRIEMSLFDNKQKLIGKNIYTVTGRQSDNNGVSATVNSQMIDGKGKPIATGTNSIKCQNGQLLMDMRMQLPQQQAKQVEAAEAKATVQSFYLEYPGSLSVGEKLKDGHFNMDMTMSGLPASINMDITDRQVEGQERITTPAGTWDCFKITSKTRMKLKTLVNIPFTIETTEWYAPGTGIIKTQSKHGSTEITKIE